MTSHSEEGGKRVYELTDQGRAELEEKAAVVSEIWERSQQEEWGGWHHAHHPEAAEVMRPVFRVMKAAFRAARLGSSQPIGITRLVCHGGADQETPPRL